jgi:hypothetical protein
MAPLSNRRHLKGIEDCAQRINEQEALSRLRRLGPNTIAKENKNSPLKSCKKLQ